MAETWEQWGFAGTVAVLSDTAASNVGTTLAEGVGAAASRDDHVHRLGAGCLDTAGMFAANVVTVDKVKHAEVDANHIGALDGDWNFGGYQLIDLIVHQSTEAPVAPALGMLWQDTDNQKLYVCTAL